MAIKTIAVTVAAGSAGSMITAKYAICLAKMFQARLVAIFVINAKVLQELLRSHIFVEVEARMYERDLEQQGLALLERIKKLAESKQVVFEPILLKGAVSDEVVARSQEIGADMLVMGELKEFNSRADVFYDEGERIFRKAACPVVVVKNPAMVESLYKEI